MHQEAGVTENDLQPQKPLWHEDTRGPRRNHPQNLVLTDAAQRMVRFNVQVGDSCTYTTPNSEMSRHVHIINFQDTRVCQHFKLLATSS